MNENDPPVVGQIFCVSLHEGGYAFGYITLIDSTSGLLCNFFNFVSETPDPPQDLVNKSIVLRGLLVGGAEFSPSKKLGEMRWKLIDKYMSGDIAPKNAFFIMRSRPAYQLIDLANERSKRPATDEEIRTYPTLSLSPIYDQVGREGRAASGHRRQPDWRRSRQRIAALIARSEQRAEIWDRPRSIRQMRNHASRSASARGSWIGQPLKRARYSDEAA